ncbi:hypothetical protein [Nocardia sp. NPDC059691]|uniref:hypothetical protein n=1 Tax=Nocardia sp. NPDC059691 TaxID=3346908 RepID=UPI0036A5454C
MKRTVDHRWHPTLVGPPAQGPHQRLGYLLGVVALHRATAALTRPRESEDSDAQRSLERADAEQRLAATDLAGPPEDLAAALTDAVVWREESALARQQLTRLVQHYRRIYGLVIDPAAATVSIDPGFDALGNQQRLETAARQQQSRLARQAAAALITAAGLDAHAQAHAVRAVSDPRSGTVRGWLDAELAAAGVGTLDRQRVVFVLAYLSGATATLDLLTEAPVMVDARAELIGMLRREMEEARDPRRVVFFGPGEYVPGPWFEAAVLSMPEPERGFARQLRVAVSEGSRMPQLPWPRQAHRAELEELVWDYVVATRDVHQAAERLAVDPEAFTGRVLNQVHDLLLELRTTRRAIVEQIDRGEGLLGIERLRVREVLDRFGLGPVEMSGLLFVSERHKQARDLSEGSRAVTVLAQRARSVIDEALDTAGIVVLEMDPAGEVAGAISDIVGSSVRDHIYDLAAGREVYDDDTRGRISFTVAVDTLDHALSHAGIAPRQRQELRATLDELATCAEELSAPLLARRHAWHEHLADLTWSVDIDVPMLQTTDPLARALFLETAPPQQPAHGTQTAIDAVLPPAIPRTTTSQPPDPQANPPAAAERGAAPQL